MKSRAVRLIVLLLVLAAFSFNELPSPGVKKVTATADPTFIVFQFYERHSQKDVDGVFALLTDDVVFARASCTPCTGKAASRVEIERAVATNPRVVLANIAVAPGKIEARTEVRGDHTRAAGVDRIVQNATFEFRGDLISSFSAPPDPTDAQTAAFQRFQQQQAVPPPTPAIVRPPATGDAGLLSDQLSRDYPVLELVAWLLALGAAGLLMARKRS